MCEERQLDSINLDNLERIVRLAESLFKVPFVHVAELAPEFLHVLV